MKRYTSILLIFLMTGQCLVNLGIVAHYQLNKEFIMEVLCINRETPDLHCNGSCFLTEKLELANQQDEKEYPVSQQQKIEIPSFLICCYKYNFQNQGIKINKYNASNGDVYFPSFLFDVFHPPQA